MQIITFIATHWVQWLFAGLLAVLGWGYRTVSARLKAEQAKNEAIAEGVQALLRESIVNSYNKYSERGACPIYGKESVKKAYAAYHQLGGNDVATELYQKILKMEEEKNDQ
jgi:hypothetical protein